MNFSYTLFLPFSLSLSLIFIKRLYSKVRERERDSDSRERPKKRRKKLTMEGKFFLIIIIEREVKRNGVGNIRLNV